MTDGANDGLWREGDHWALRYRGREARLRNAKGLSHLGTLLERPGAEIHVLELVAVSERATAPAAGSRSGLTADDAAGAGAGLDEQAKAAYERIVRERGVDTVRTALDQEATARAWKLGRELGFEEAMARARALAEPPALAEH